MIITPEIWTILSNTIESLPDAPLWLKEQGRLNWEAVSLLPQFDSAIDGQYALPTAEEKLVSPDYLGFLKEQITLNARNAEWLDLLRRRLADLAPFVGKELLLATFHCRPHSAMLRIEIGTQKLVHAEII